MELPLFPSPRSDALRSLAMADTLLEARELFGSRYLAQMARDADPSLVDADRILAIADTLLGAERRLENNQIDWLAVIHLTPLEGLDFSLISGRFSRLRSLLDPHTNRHPLAEEAFNLINEAYPILTNPASTGWRSLLDAHFGSYLQQPPPPQQLAQGGQSSDGVGGSVSVQVYNFMGLPNSEFGSGSSTSGSGHVQLHDFLGVNASENVDVEVVDDHMVAGNEDEMGSQQSHQFYIFI